MPQSFIKMMRRQKNSLPEKEKNTDVGKNQTDMSSDGGLFYNIRWKGGSWRRGQPVVQKFLIFLKTFDVFDLHLISFWIIILYLCLEKKVNNKWWKLFLLNFLRSNFLFGVVSAALINHLLFIKMKLWQNWENHLQRAHLRGKGDKGG